MNDFRDAVVRDVMTSEVHTIAATAPLLEAARKMVDEGVSCLVVDSGRAADGLGIITQKDILNWMADLGCELDDMIVGDSMTQPVVSVPPHYGIGTCLKQMRMLGVRRVTVVEGEQMIGFVTYTDIFRFALR